MIRRILARLFPPRYESGMVYDIPARRDRKTVVVQFVLWKAGEQGHASDYWYPMGAGNADNFRPSNPDGPA